MGRALQNMRLYARMFGFARPYHSLFAVSIGLSFVIVGLEAIYLWVPASLIKTLFEPEIAPMVKPEFSLHNLNMVLKYWTYETVRAGDPFETLKLVCVMMIVACAMKNACAYAQALVVGRINLNIVQDMRDRIYRHVLMLPISYFDRNRSGNLVSKILNDVAAVNQSITQSFNRLLLEPLRVIVYLALLFVISVKLTLIVLLIYPVLGYGIMKIGQSVRRRSKRMLANLSGLVSVLNETINGLRVVKMFNMNDFEARKFQIENLKFVKASFRQVAVHSSSSPITETLGVMMTGLLLWYGGRQVLTPGSGFGAEDFLRFLFLLLSSYRPLHALGNVNMSLQSGIAAADRIFETLDDPVEPLRPLDPRNVPPFERSLEFRDVSFRYPGCDEWVLQDVSFSVGKGQIVAIVGPSGSGKSTILDSIPRFYDIERGAILLDGADIRGFDLVGFRQLFGIVSQDTFLFNDTVFANIAYGVPRASREDVTLAARTANAWEFIERMPQGLDTIVGERGETLSGGQRQRIAIARALLKDPPILILDEATSSLDTESERVVQGAMGHLMRNRTTVVVAHRLSTVRNADLILVLESGRIVERGKHRELLALNGRYRRLHDMQFGDVGEDDA